MIVLLTDFGIKDHYVGVMKGIIKRFAPRAQIVDLTHQVMPQNVKDGLWRLWDSYSYFPEKTFFLSVVDPGVGTERKILILEQENRFFIAPDNGILSPFLNKKMDNLWKLKKNVSFFSKTSVTFHGRDLFSPLVAQLYNLPRERWPILVEPFSFPQRIPYLPQISQGEIKGEIAYIDRFGNIITNIEWSKIPFSQFDVFWGKEKIGHYFPTYQMAPEGELFYLEGSSSRLEIALKNGSAYQKGKELGIESNKIFIKNGEKG